MAGLRNSCQRRVDSGLDRYDPELSFHHPGLSDSSFQSMDVHISQPWHIYPQALDNHHFPGMRLPISTLKDTTMLSLPVPDVPSYMIYPGHENPSGIATSPWTFDTPSVSGTGSSYSDSRFSGSQSPPQFSPNICHDAFPSDRGVMDVPLCHETFYFSSDRSFVGENSYVAPHDVHHDADHEFDGSSLEEEHCYPQAYMGCAQEGYVPMKAEDDCDIPVDTPAMTTDDTGSCCAELATDIPPSNLRRASTTRPRRPTMPAAGRSNSKITKNGHRVKRSNRRTTVHHLVDTKPCPDRAFVCLFAIYGCDSSFKSKNEWKRHVNTQHMRLGLWRCNQCPPRENPNDFNRKDLFIQHVRRMHLAAAQNHAEAAAVNGSSTKSSNKSVANKTKNGTKLTGSSNVGNEEAILAQAASRCYVRLRQPPEQTRCLVCEHTFQGARTSWDERLEHIGQHMEAMKKGDEKLIAPSQWNEDDELETWLLREGVVVEGPYGLTLADCKA